MIFQEPRRSLDPSFTVGSQIAEAVRVHRGMSRRDAWQRALELLDRVEIPRGIERARQYPHELSGGMCQRVMLAIALACDPSVLIADEPTTALDVTVQAAILRLISDMQRELGLAVLLITHDLAVVAETCDRVAVMYAGQIVEEGGVVEIFDRPLHPYTRGLQTAAPESRGRPGASVGLNGAPADPSEWSSGCRFQPRCAYAVSACGDEVPAAIFRSERMTRCRRADELVLGGAS
jgi:oligopeptide/dipeptide ABC transporter ATP-binding protein